MPPKNKNSVEHDFSVRAARLPIPKDHAEILLKGGWLQRTVQQPRL